MGNTQQNVPPAPPSPAKIAILLVSPHADDESALRPMLAPGDPTFQRCATAEEAIPQICSDSPAVVICERDLPDGNWKMILRACEAQLKAPLVLVTSRHADDGLWAEVLNLGGYDVLMKPFDSAEVVRVLGMTWRQWSQSIARLPAATQFA